jgi:hypothetical protein
VTFQQQDSVNDRNYWCFSSKIAAICLNDTRQRETEESKYVNWKCAHYFNCHFLEVRWKLQALTTFSQCNLKKIVFFTRVFRSYYVITYSSVSNSSV